MEALIVIAILLYTAWAVFSGYKFLTGKNEWLDQRNPVAVITKVFLSVIIGYVIAIVYGAIWLIKGIAILFAIITRK